MDIIEAVDLEKASPIQFSYSEDISESSTIQSINFQPGNIPLPNWELWRNRGACRIWKAVLISMAIKPGTKVRTQLRFEHPSLYKEYLRRKKDVIALYGLHSDFRAIQHSNAGNKSSEQYILLSSLLSYAKKHRWEHWEIFEKGMQIPDHEPGSGVVSNVSFELLPEAARNGLVRAGALLKLLEEVLVNKEFTNAEAFLHGKKLNISKVAIRVEQIVCKSAGQEKVDNFTSEANRKYLGDAQNSLRANW